MAKPTWQKGIPLNDSLQERLRALLRERGEDAITAMIGVGKSSIVRAAAGLGLRRGTAFVIEARLATMEKAA
jgi:hypothetical protein